MTPAELFTRCCQALCGFGPRWKEQAAELLKVKVNSIDNMSKGTSRIPQGIWVEISGHVLQREELLRELKRPIELAAFQSWQDAIGKRRADNVVE